MPATTYSTLACDVRTYIAEKTLSIAAKELRFYQLGDKADLPERFGKTFQYTRYDRLALPTATLTEGTAPAATALSISVVTAVAEQWGGLVTLTDVAELTIAHKPLQKAIELLGHQAAETIDREVYKVLMAGTNVWFGSAADDSNRAAVATNAVTQENALRAIVADLRNKGARGMEAPEKAFDDPGLGDMYVGVIDPYVEMDITTMAGFINSNQYANAKRLWNGEAGTLHGVRWLRTNVIPTITSLATIVGTHVTSGGALGTVAAVYNFVITGVDVNTGYERLISQESSLTLATVATAIGRIDLTMPTDTAFTYNVYGNTTLATQSPGQERLILSGLAAGATTAIASLAAATAALVPPLPASANSKIHTSFIFGKEAYTVVNLKGLQSYLTPPGPSESDPLAQRRHCGWKVFFKSVINNNNFFARYEAESTFD